MKILKLLVLIMLIPLIHNCGNVLEDEPGIYKDIEISEIKASPSADSAVISFKTDIASRHIIYYGTEKNTYKLSTDPSPDYETSHSISIASLSPETTYYYTIRVFDSVQLETSSGEEAFTTSMSPSIVEKSRGIWIIGGLSGNTVDTVVSSVDLYDPVTKTWYNGITTLPVPVSFASCTMADGFIYVIGGFDSTGAVSASVQIYNISSDEWTTGSASGFTGTANIGSFIYGEKIYILAGTTGNASDAWAGSMATQVYDITGDSWSTIVNMSTANSSERYGAAFNGVIYFMGGRSSASYPIYTNDGISIANNARTSTTEIVLPSRRTGQSTVIYQPSEETARMIIIGGFTVMTNVTGNFVFQYTSTPTTTPVNTCYYLNYPFTQGSWTSFTNSYPVPQGFAAGVIRNDILYVFGGVSGYNSGGLSICYTIDLSGLPDSSWNVIDNMPSGRYGHSAVIDQ